MDVQGNHRLRKGRFSEVGRVYLLTTTTRDLQPFFAHFPFARSAINQLRLCEEQGIFRSLAWVLMPDHLHWLIELGEGNLSELMKSFKSRCTCALYRAGAKRQRIWQPGFHDRALRKHEDLKTAARYIIANPVRAGLVSRARDYPHWDCVWL